MSSRCMATYISSHLLIVKRPEGTGQVIATSEVGWRMLLFVVLPVAWLFGSRQVAVRIE